MASNKNAVATRTLPSEPIPEWATFTPRALEHYTLQMWVEDREDSYNQIIDLKLEEYDALKLALARMRGYPVQGGK